MGGSSRDDVFLLLDATAAEVFFPLPLDLDDLMVLTLADGCECDSFVSTTGIEFNCNGSQANPLTFILCTASNTATFPSPPLPLLLSATKSVASVTTPILSTNSHHIFPLSSMSFSQQYEFPLKIIQSNIKASLLLPLRSSA